MQERTFAGHPEMVRSDADVGKSRNGGLLLIGAFKLANSLLFICVGFGAFHLVHKDLGEAALRLAAALRFNPEWRITSLLLEKVTLVDAHKLRQFGVFTFCYAGLHSLEGIGLMLEKAWAEYLTLSLTVMFLPWELYELVRRPTWIRLALLLINLAVLAYILWVLERKKKATA